jgi:hypothetical protein
LEEVANRCLTTVAGLGPPAELTRAQTRRLDELAAFLEALNLNDGTSWPRRDEFEDLREPWYRLVAALGGFDLTVLAAQALVVQKELEEDEDRTQEAFYRLFDGAQRVELQHWSNVEDAESARALAVRMLAGARGLAFVAAAALSTHPDPDETGRLIEERLPAVPPGSKRAAVYAVLSLSGNTSATRRLAADADEGIREAVAAIGPVIAGSDVTPLGRELALDGARSVQNAVLDRIEKISKPTPGVLALLEELAVTPPSEFLCHRCGAMNESERSYCESCRVVEEIPGRRARSILEKLELTAS